MSWNEVNTGLPYLYAYALAASGSHLFVGTIGGGVWGRPLPEMITDVESGGLPPSSFALSQNYPNPFNPTTVIKYQLAAAGEVNLTVYDILGRTTAVLADGRMAAGQHEVRFDGAGLASGVYLYRLIAGRFVQNRKMVFMR